MLTHSGQVMLICISKLGIIGSDNDWSPAWCKAIIWTKDRILLIWPLGINVSEKVIKIAIFSFKEMPLKMASAKMLANLSQPQCVLIAFQPEQTNKYWSLLNIINAFPCIIISFIKIIVKPSYLCNINSFTSEISYFYGNPHLGTIFPFIFPTQFKS